MKMISVSRVRLLRRFRYKTSPTRETGPPAYTDLMNRETPAFRGFAFLGVGKTLASNKEEGGDVNTTCHK